ncbi:MAG: 2-amino-4-hydroxy-6-hydroxymethyldihydropteridine diphosphokinase [Chitinophagaceae bacterium]
MDNKISMNGIYLIIGGNKGDRWQYIQSAIQHIEAEIGLVQKMSKVYETSAWGLEEQAAFLNCVLFIKSDLEPDEVLEKCLHIEKKMGRLRQKKWEPREMDIDILFYNDRIIHTKKLTIPHPYLAKRRFVLRPLAEIAPQFIHPVFKLTIEKLLSNCEDPLSVSEYYLSM